METDPPERPIRSLRDFLVALVTITVGVLIALSLEGIVGWRHNRRLVRDARANLAREVQDNLREIEGTLQALPRLEKEQHHALQFIHELLTRKKTDIHEVKFSYVIPRLSVAGWNTAAATGALGHMPYTDVQKYARLYDLQEQFVRLQDKLLERVAFIPAGDPMAASPRELEEWREKITSSRAILKIQMGLAKGLRAAYAEAAGNR